MNATRTAALAALTAGLAVTACTSGRPPAPVITIAPAPAPAARPTTTAKPESRPTTNAGSDATTNDVVGFADSGDPKGTPVQFAIRYLNDLRSGRWTAAVAEMAAVERATIRVKDNAAAVGRDVLTNAAGQHRALPHCTAGVMVGRDAVVVRCGDARVMVHVETWRGFRGVKVDGIFVARDHVDHPHTHAYTALLS
jgi:hypothetical protein